MQLARSVAAVRGVASVRWLADDFLHTHISDTCGAHPTLGEDIHAVPHVSETNLRDFLTVWLFSQRGRWSLQCPNLVKQGCSQTLWDGVLLHVTCVDTLTGKQEFCDWCRFDLITDKGTFDAVGLAEGAPAKQRLYVRAAASLLKPSVGLLVVTSCNSTREELMGHFCRQSSGGGHGAEGGGLGASEDGGTGGAGHDGVCQDGAVMERAEFEYVDHVRTYPTFRFGGREGSRVCTVAFRRVGSC